MLPGEIRPGHDVQPVPLYRYEVDWQGFGSLGTTTMREDATTGNDKFYGIDDAPSQHHHPDARQLADYNPKPGTTHQPVGEPVGTWG